MNAVQYKGWRIEAQSYESEGGRWRPKALVSSAEGGSIRTRPLTWFNETRDTEAAYEGREHPAKPTAATRSQYALGDREPLIIWRPHDVLIHGVETARLLGKLTTACQRR